ncbi:MAG: hypothetical protein JSV58_02810 [Candidatus Bathyarchaeota archaeon]|nr:MAG: hypothetical protein JSV58_02810 [Candidatus Bathyarchaeota archaeon]
MYIQKLDARRGNMKAELKTLGCVISLNKSFFKTRDLTNMLGIKPKGRHKLSHVLEALVNQRLIEIYHRNSRNLYHIPVWKKLLDAYYESLWNYVSYHPQT